MKCVYLFALVSLCQGLPLKTRVAQLSAPNEVEVSVLDPLAIKVSWNMIFSGDEEDPVLGYKVKIWEVKNTKGMKYAIVDGKVTQIVEEQEEPIDLISSPSGMPEVILTTAEETSATYHNVKLDVTYEIRVQAYTKNQDGPMSSPIRVKLDKD